MVQLGPPQIPCDNLHGDPTRQRTKLNIRLRQKLIHEAKIEDPGRVPLAASVPGV